MADLKCGNCGFVWTTEATPKEFVCERCGAVNVVPVSDGAYDEPLGCLLPTGFEWKLPAGRIGNPLVGYKYVTSQGTQMTRDEYIAAFKIDPEIALAYMRGRAGGIKFGKNAE
ncbi:MAG TPA: hypothetical protein PK659_09725 [Methanothrix sp.]|nr:hypothetical protein [Methanothrix sp.]HOL44519.1 hypothetical protein [Methanothrix sp.]